MTPIRNLDKEYRNVGACGRIFKEFECCDDPKLDDLCWGCCMNDEEDEWEMIEE